MATSHFHQIAPLLRYVEALRPASILDVGAGIGKWGFLCRDRLEFLEGRYDRRDWKTRIYGVELFADYRNPLWDYCYDKFWRAAVLDVVDDIPDIDVVLLPDVLSLLPKEEGVVLVDRLAAKARFMLVSTPVTLPGKSDGAHDHNPATAVHRSFWASEDFTGRWMVGERVGMTQVFLIDQSQTAAGPLVVEPAERHSFAELVRALALKLMRRVRLPTGSFVDPRDVGRHLQ